VSRRSITRLPALVALAVAMAGCHASRTDTGAGKGNASVTPEQSRSEIIQALHDTWRELRPLNVTASPYGNYVQCIDQGGAVEYVAAFRLDSRLAADPPLAGRLDPALSAAGWVMQPRSTPTGAGAVSHGTKGALTVAVNTYTDPEIHYVLFEIAGPCLDVGDADQTYIAKTDKTLPLS
jgi:hypothetical protein